MEIAFQILFSYSVFITIVFVMDRRRIKNLEKLADSYKKHVVNQDKLIELLK